MATTNEIKYGWVSGGRTGREYPVAADQYFHRMGGHFVYANAAGNLTLIATAAQKILGWAETPKDAAGYSAWKSSATAKVDSVFVITDANAVYAIPVFEAAASLTASLVGDVMNIATRPPAASGYDAKQLGQPGLHLASYEQLIIQDIDSVGRIAYVKINYAGVQADS